MAGCSQDRGKTDSPSKLESVGGLFIGLILAIVAIGWTKHCCVRTTHTDGGITTYEADPRAARLIWLPSVVVGVAALGVTLCRRRLNFCFPVIVASVISIFFSYNKAKDVEVVVSLCHDWFSAPIQGGIHDGKVQKVEFRDVKCLIARSSRSGRHSYVHWLCVLKSGETLELNLGIDAYRTWDDIKAVARSNGVWIEYAA